MEQVLRLVQELPTLVLNQQVQMGSVQQFDSVRRQASGIASGCLLNPEGLEIKLFKDILGVGVDTLKYIYNAKQDDRGHIEGIISEWNKRIDEQLNFAHFWRQDERFTLTVDYKDGVIYFEIRDKTNSIYTFRERSGGMKFFLSYYIQARAMELKSRNKHSIILMDEPDAALSVLGQRNLLSIFESLVSPESSGQTCQLIYTTHSPYLINRNFPRRIRVVKKEDAEEGTQYVEKARQRRYEPVRTALGIDSAPSLFLGMDNVLLEGASDQFLLAELIRLFATPDNVGEFLDLNSVSLVSADGVGNVPGVLSQSKWADEPVPPTVVLVDSDDEGKKIQARITGSFGHEKKLIDGKFVGDLAGILAINEWVTLEDLIPTGILLRSVISYFTIWYPSLEAKARALLTSASEANSFRSEGADAELKKIYVELIPESKGDYDKMGLVQEVIKEAESLWQHDHSNPEVIHLKTNIALLCNFARDGLSASRKLNTAHSAAQGVKRNIRDFFSDAFSQCFPAKPRLTLAQAR